MSLSPEAQLIVAREAERYDVPAAHLCAVVDIESGGNVFASIDGRDMPLILFEPHVFYRRISGAVREEAVRRKLASKRWNRKLYARTQKGRWEQIRAAAALLKEFNQPTTPAFESASYGVGQVMGYHWKALGYKSWQGFYDTVINGIEGQVEVMMRYIITNKLDDELREGRWASFARGYNGPAYRENKYDTKMANAALRYGGAEEPADGLLRMGAKGARVRELQALLVRAGHPITVDGDFGPATRDALRKFQIVRGLSVDGVYGPETEGALAELRQSAAEKPGQQKATDVDEVKQGAGGVAVGVGLEVARQAVDEATRQIEGLGIAAPIIDYAMAGLSFAAAGIAIAGAVWALKGWMESRRTVEV